MNRDRAEIHLIYAFRGEHYKVIAWGKNSLMEHRFAGISGLTMRRAVEKSIADHLADFGATLRLMLS